ncbi:oligosaccharide flippase family protein [Shouchella sp. 1P09AA]|uniref:lipopolysaccharide biosynthesis protein n=1 Tax=unclassified Shouchella TaxID=2893065 RepID=UPI0039A1A2D0
MSKLIQKIMRNGFLKKVTMVASGTAIAQLIAILSTPIVARLYGPEIMGVFGAFVAMANMLTKVSGLTYPVSIVLPKRDNHAKLLIQGSLCISIIIAFILLLLIIFFNEQISNLFNLQEIQSYLFLIPLIVVFSVMLQVSEQWLIRVQKFKLTAKATILKSLVVNSSKVGIGLFHPVAIVLILLNVLNDVIHTLVIMNGLKPNIKKNLKLNRLKFIKIKVLLLKYKDFPLYRAPQELINGISTNLPVLLLTSFLGPVYAGYYTITRTVMKVPTELLSKSIGDVFYPHIVITAKNKKSIFKPLFRLTLGLSVLGIGIFGVVFVFGPSIFKLILGSEWLEAGYYARWLSIWFFFVFINRPSTKAIPLLKIQGPFLVYEIISGILRLVAMTLGFIIYNNGLVAIIFLSLTSAFMNLLLIVMTHIYAMKFDKNNMKYSKET